MKSDSKKAMLLMIASSAAVICMIVLFFFRTSLFVGAFRNILHILEPFLYGAVIAWLLHPVCVRTEKIIRRIVGSEIAAKHGGAFRTLSVLISIALLLLLFALLLLAILPELIVSISGLVSQLPGVLQRFQAWAASLDETIFPEEMIGDLQMVMETVTARLQSFLKTDLLPRLQTVASNMLSSFRGLLSVLKNVGLGSIIAAYILGSWEKFGAQLHMINYALLPEKAADWIRREALFTNEKFSGFIIGKLVDSLIIGLICFVFVSLTRMPYAMLISLIIGLTNIIPFFGPYMGAIPSAILILTVSPGKCLIFVVFIILLQQLDGNVIGPMILGDRLGLSGFWILFAILVFGSAWGLVGMLIGAPVFAVLYDLIRRSVRRALAVRGQQDILESYDRQYPADDPDRKGLREQLQEGVGNRKSARKNRRNHSDG